MTIGITDNGHPDLDRYLQWISRVDPKTVLIRLSAARRNAVELDRCHGLILTGGGDVHPRFYGRDSALDLVRGVDIERDEFEFALVHRTLDLQIPALGICRGMQVFNVANGGTLIPDVEHAGFRNHRRHSTGADRMHAVRIEPRTLLREIVGVDYGEVNSSHHQAVDKIGRQLRAVARSEDGLTEALENEDGSERPFVLLVQWHPERMSNSETPFSGSLLKRFLTEANVANTEKGFFSEQKTRNT